MTRMQRSAGTTTRALPTNRVPLADHDQIRPAHYRAGAAEVIDLVEHLPFNRGNAIKYLARAGLKPEADELVDLEKAAWYVQREIERIKRLRNDVKE